MILDYHIPQHDVLRSWFPQEGEMLMLGNQDNQAGYSFGLQYQTLDIDGGDIKADLSSRTLFDALPLLRHRYRIVYNLGTLEHIWDIHQAYVNSSEMLQVGGIFANVVPTAGSENHGIHVSNWKYIVKFFEVNGYEVRESFFTTQYGKSCDAPRRRCGENVLHWMCAEKVTQVRQYQAPQQQYEEGKSIEPTFLK